MNRSSFILTIDQGTTSTKAAVLADDGSIVSTSAPQRFAIEPHYPQAGWVEFDPAELWESVRGSAQAALQHAGITWSELAGLGLANQGESIIAFDGRTGEPIYPVISWQDRRGDEWVERWRSAALEHEVLSITGLRLDAYFSAPKMAWILQSLPDAKRLLATGHLRIATTDAWLLWRMTGGKRYVTDVTTASRTMLLDLNSLTWSSTLSQAFEIPLSILPDIVSNAEPIGSTDPIELGGKVEITGLCVDQQAALFGQHAFQPGQTKVTYGTGCFVQANVGTDAARRASGLLTSVGWRIGGQTHYVLEGGVYSAGSMVDWLTELGLIAHVDDIDSLVSVQPNPSPVSMIPAFSGLGAPRWSSRARACWLGMDQGTTRSQLVQATIEAIAFRVREICDAMAAAGVKLDSVHVDGGLTQCESLMSIQSAALNLPLSRRDFVDATLLGAGYFAGVGTGWWSSVNAVPPMPGGATYYHPQEDLIDRYRTAFDVWQRRCSAVVDMGAAGLFEERS